MGLTIIATTPPVIEIDGTGLAPILSEITEDVVLVVSPNATSVVQVNGGLRGEPGAPGSLGIGLVRYIGPTEPDTSTWNIDDFWYDTSTES